MVHASAGRTGGSLEAMRKMVAVLDVRLRSGAATSLGRNRGDGKTETGA
jgi:hypothetical protein